MLRYEALFLTMPEITAEEAADIESRLQKLLKECGGTSLSFERWGKYLLAYPIRKNEYGVYYLTRFEIPKASAFESLEKIRKLFAVRFNTTVMRHMLTELDPKRSLEYKRPESLEEAPRREEFSGREGRGFERRDRRSAPEAAGAADEVHEHDDVEISE